MMSCTRKGYKLRNALSLGLITIEQIQDLIANTEKVQLGGWSCRVYMYTKPYTKSGNTLCMARGFQPPKF